MSEKEKQIIEKLAEKLPYMTERQRGYLEGTIDAAAAMSERQSLKSCVSRSAQEQRKE